MAVSFFLLLFRLLIINFNIKRETLLLLTCKNRLSHQTVMYVPALLALVILLLLIIEFWYNCLKRN